MTKQNKKKMYYDYCRELDQYAKEKDDSRKHAYQVAEIYLSEPEFEWIDIISENTVCGFLIIGKDLKHVHGKGLYICEAYVVPEKRNRKLMTNAVREVLVKIQPKFIYMEIFDNNTGARRFWESRMKEINAILIGTQQSTQCKEINEYIYLKRGE